ncbi:hypothetical protein AaE_000252, partial [Aphanomyces astaci]
MIRDANDQPRYSEHRRDVEAGLRATLDNWIPANERTTRPTHLDTWDVRDGPSAPRFIRDWLVDDMAQPPPIHHAFLHNGKCTWDAYRYDADCQAQCDRTLRRGVSPGFGGVSQELWIAAPPAIRERESLIINTILRTGLVPPSLKRKQMIFLPKAATAHGVVGLDPGSPPWRPITVQSAFASRVFTVIRNYIGPQLPNEELQHGFQRHRTVHDAAILTTLLLERAQRKGHELFLVSKDCLKCYDRVPGWVMEYVYLQLGIPATPRRLMAAFLTSGQIDIRTAFGWLNGGTREFGLGQGSILAVMHIGYYMDVLQRRQQQGPDGVNILHHQSPDGRVINSTLFVDDALDIATSYTGIQHRATTSNIFTGIHGSGGVFGAAKSFMIYYSPSGLHYPTVDLNDGLGLPQPVTMAPPMEGFKHLGIQQGFGGTWDITISATWTKLKQDVHRAAACQLTLRQFQYLVNSVWLPRILYRTTLSPAIHVASAFDTLIRRAARRNFRLPYCTPRAFYYDTVHGLGLRACETHTVYDVMMEALEDWAKRHGLTTHPLAQPAQMKPADTSFLGTTLGLLAKHAATCGVVARWTSPTWQAPKRYNDRPILPLLDGQQVGALMVINRRFPWQLRHVGDVCNIDGTYVLDDDTLAVRTGWPGTALLTLRRVLQAIPTIPGSRRLRLPVGRSPRPATTMGNYVDTPLYGLVLRAVLLTRPNSPDELSYVIGQRTALATRTDASGIQLTITNWHEHRRGS